jgi:hypothetical protein
MLVWQVVPVHPAWQLHVNDATPSLHEPWLEQLWPMQSSMLVSQFAPS